MRKIALFLFILLNIEVYSQVDISQKFPPTPEITSLIKIDKQDINLNTGSPKISLPLYEIKTNSFNYPISLEYSSSQGIKVDEIASNVGLGWALAGQGMITRITKDLPDDESNGYLYTPYTTKNIELMQYDAGSDFGAIKENIDTEPDHFILSVANMNINFYYDRDIGQFIQAPLSSVKINPIYTNNKITQWKVQDTQGNIYYFGLNNDAEYTQYSETISVDDSGASASLNNTTRHITSWYLSKITTSTSREINFEYIGQNSYYLNDKIEESFIYEGNKVISPNNNINKRTYSRRNTTEKSLKKISFENTTIDFILDSTNRKDLTQIKPLKEIIIKYDNIFNKKITFIYDYFDADVSFLFDNLYSNSGDLLRLKLNAIHITNGSNQTPDIYSFSYNSTKLPRRFSYAQDAWGYFNGINNSSLIPKTNMYSITGVNGIIGSSDRSISESKTQACILNQITYPTKGSISYEYENNEVSLIQNLKYSSIYFEKKTEDWGLFPEVEISPTSTNVVFQNEYRKTLTLENDANIIADTQIENCSGNYFNDLSCSFRIQILNLTTNTTMFIEQPHLEFQLPKGNYEIIAKKTPNNNSVLTYGFSISFTIESNKINDSKIKTGGLRLKSYALLDADNQLKYKKVFDYSVDNIKSSGVTISYPIFYYSVGSVGSSYKISSNSILPTSKSSTVYYKKITESEVDELGSSLGKKESLYNVDLKTDPELDNLKRTLSIDRTEISFQWRNNIIEESFYDTNNKILKNISYEYSSKRKYVNPLHGGIFEYRSMHPDTNHPFYLYQFYPLITEFYSLDKIINTDYMYNGIIKTTTENFYINSSHFEVTNQKKSLNNGETLETKYSYAHEKGNQPMIAANMVSIPLQTETFNNGNLVSSQETIYQQNSATNNFILPTQVFGKKETQQTNELKLTYNSYDSKGNLTQYTPESGAPVSIIWGYNNTLVVAKVEGVAYSSIPSNLITAIQTATDSPTGTEAQVITALNALRSNLPNAMVTTFTHKPLIGVSTITDPKGLTTTYIYDAFNRLQQVKDHQGNILSQNQYNYRPQ